MACLCVAAWTRHSSHIMQGPACISVFPSFHFFFSFSLHGWNYRVTRCLAAQSSTTPAKGENRWRRGGREKGGPVYAVVARHEGPPTHLKSVWVPQTEQQTHPVSSRPHCPSAVFDCCRINLHLHSSVAENPNDCVPVSLRSREVKRES